MVPDLSWPEIVDGLKQHSLDAIITLTHRPDRESFANFTRMYLPTPLVIMTRDDNQIIKAESDLTGKTVALVDGYASTKRVIEEYPGINPLLVKTAREGLFAVAIGKADAYIGVLGINLHIARDNGITNLQVASLYGDGVNGQNVGVRKDWPELAVILDKALDAITKSEEQAFYERWLPGTNFISQEELIAFQQQKSNDLTSEANWLSDEERNYLQSHPVFSVCIRSDNSPVEGEQEARLTGIAGSIYQRLSELLGVSFQVVKAESDAGFYENVRQNRCQLVSVIQRDQTLFKNIATTRNVILSQHLVAVGHIESPYIDDLANFSGAEFYVRDALQLDLVKQLYPSLALVLEQDLEKIMRDIAENSDKYLLDLSFSADDIIQQFGANRYKVVNLFEEFHYAGAIGVNLINPEILPILDKAIARLGQDALGAIASEFRLKSYNIVSYQWLWYLLALAVLVIVFLGFRHQQQQHLNQARKKELKIQKDLIEVEESANKKLKVLADQLMTSKAQQERIFAIIGHELRTPAAAIKMMLGKQTLDAELLNETADHILNVLDDMRSVIEPGIAIKGKVSNASVYSVIRKAMIYQERLLQEAGLEVLLEDETGGVCKKLCRMNVQLLRQLTLNLIKNCALHSGASFILLRISLLDDQPCHYQIRFEDNGAGIDRERQASLFQAFQRGETQADGSGLGLHVSQKFAREHLHGDLTYEDRKDGGAVFVLTARFSQPEVGEASSEFDHSALQNKRILFAEDNHMLQMMTQELLVAEGAQVTAVSNGRVALQLAEKSDFDLIITDLFMPEMDGFTLIEKLRGHGFDRLIIAITAATVGDETDKALQSGTDRVMAKPVDMNQLKKIVSELTDNPR